jgi:hypothetical protein
MAFPSLKLKSESGANRIKSADDAYSFVAHMRLSSQNKPHWQMARQVACGINSPGWHNFCLVLTWTLPSRRERFAMLLGLVLHAVTLIITVAAVHDSQVRRKGGLP